MRKIMFVAGESSGDLHAAEVVKALKARQPNTECFGVAGPHMREAGVRAIFKSEDIAVMGFVEVFKHLNLIRAAFDLAVKALEDERPDALILVDYPGFNLRLAAYAHDKGIRVMYYISPQLWAWKPGRIRLVKKYVDHMVVIFPFEADFYREHGVRVTYVGCPLLDELDLSLTKTQAREKLNLPLEARVVALMPGSREAVFQCNLPEMLKAATLLQKKFPEIIFLLPIANTLNKNRVAKTLPENIRLLDGQSSIAIKAADAVICTSGTSTLETALLGTPMVMIYRMSWMSFQIIKRLIQIKKVGLCNIVAEKPIVRELIQSEANAKTIAEEIERLLTDVSYRAAMIDDFAALREKLGKPGASERMAALI